MLVDDGPPVTQNDVPQNAPQPFGGPFVDGLYHLTAFVVYTGTGGTQEPNGAPVSETIQYHVGTYAVTGHNAILSLNATGTFSTTNGTITTAVTCPMKSNADTSSYSAAGNVVRIYATYNMITTEATYTRK